jgi:hypothetical protein
MATSSIAGSLPSTSFEQEPYDTTQLARFSIELREPGSHIYGVMECRLDESGPFFADMCRATKVISIRHTHVWVFDEDYIQHLLTMLLEPGITLERTRPVSDDEAKRAKTPPKHIVSAKVGPD